eukprot:scaffold15168_cov126-Isochrysis_galbana.AAC.2
MEGATTALQRENRFSQAIHFLKVCCHSSDPMMAWSTYLRDLRTHRPRRPMAESRCRLSSSPVINHQGGDLTSPTSVVSTAVLRTGTVPPRTSINAPRVASSQQCVSIVDTDPARAIAPAEGQHMNLIAMPPQSGTPAASKLCASSRPGRGPLGASCRTFGARRTSALRLIMHAGRGPGAIWEYPYGWPAREACCCPHNKVQRGEYFAGPEQRSARLSTCALTAK